MNKDSKKENLWMIGGLLIILGGSLISLFMLSNEGVYSFSDLNLYAAGFLITGLIVLVFGFLLALICLEKSKTEKQAENTNKIRIVLIIMTALYIILIGYLIAIDQEWTIRALIIEAESFDPSFGFYETFTISSYNALFATILSFGIFVLPFVINELGILDNYPNEQPTHLDEGQSIEDAEAAFDRFAAYLKRRFGATSKIKKFALPMGIALTILGSCLVGLPYFLFIDGPLSWDLKTETLFITEYKGFIRGKLLLMGLLFLVIGLILIIHYIRRRRHATGK